MIEHLIYGKIIIDDIQLADGSIARNILGGGGPQAAFGARLWHESIGFLTRSGTDLPQMHVDQLRALKVDLAGWHQYADIPTPYNRLASYDDDEYLQTGERGLLARALDLEAWDRLLAQPLQLPTTYQQPRSIHLITEFFDDEMMQTAQELRSRGALLSLEPIVDYEQWQNRDALLDCLSTIDLVCPDWPTASGIADTDDPNGVLTYWAGLGPEVVAIRHGGNGSYVWSKDEDRMWHVPVLPTEIVDPTGGGNSYSGGFCVSWARYRDVRKAACCATISARYLITRVGVPTVSDGLMKEAQALVAELSG